MSTTKFGKNVIFCGPAQMIEHPIRKEAMTAAGIAPGTLVALNGEGKFAASGTGLLYVLDRDHLGQQPVTRSYDAGEIATAFWPASGVILNVRAAPGLKIAEDYAVYASANGMVTNVKPADADAKPIGYAAESLITNDAPALLAIKFV